MMSASQVSQISLREQARGSSLCFVAVWWDSQVLVAEGAFLKPSHAQCALLLLLSAQWPHPEGLCGWSVSGFGPALLCYSNNSRVPGV